ncbi:hypothetical protein [Rhizobium sp. RU36D]|uniref:hypothetical protein n=1 Tax=Rhizobium sp. RU36D TaxID=1907415 RepID=UPI0009D8449B|nr:hypothetical protein [Rhizobium sp. RU36D]SMD08831.1 hypothetical protein SAMN05880593_12068 [Rhizobium sp. RU36D]
MTLPTSQSTGLIPVESAASAVSWGPVIAGAVAAASTSVVLLLVGSGLGLTMVSPWSGQSSSLATIGAAAAAFLIVVQWLSAGIGGYLTGRLRTRWAGLRTDEVFFRDTAHGFLAWGIGTLFVAGVLSSAVSSVINTGVQATATAAGTGVAAATAMTESTTENSGFSLDYFTDSLLRPAAATPPAEGNDERVTAEVGRILVNSATAGEMPQADRTYLAQVVATRTGLSQADAEARVDATLTAINDAKVAAQQAADDARQAASAAALVGALSLVIGAFISSAAAAFGGHQRDEEEDLIAVR